MEGVDARASRRLLILMPVKPFACAKRRLSPLLSQHEREALAQAMLLDVLGAATAVWPQAAVAVVTADDEVAAIARTHGVAIVSESSPRGVNPAVASAAAVLAETGGAPLLVLPTDVPLITPD